MKRVVFKGISLFLGLVAGLVIVEVFTRVLYPPSEELTGTVMLEVGSPPDFLSEVGSFPWRNSKYRHRVIGDFDNIVAFNDHGLRGPVIPYEKPPGEIRILYIGDSFVEAAEVQDHETVCYQLQKLFRDNGLNVTVIGAGQSGWGTDQQYLYYHHEGYKYAPDLVLYQFITNDVTDNASDSFGHKGQRQQYFGMRNGELVSVQNTESKKSQLYYLLAKINRHLFLSSRLYALLKAARKGGNIDKLAAPVQTPLNPSAAKKPHPLIYAFQEPYTAQYEEAWALTESLIAQWDAEVRHNDSAFGVAYGPSHWAIHDWDEIPVTYPVLQDEFPKWRRDKPDTYLAGITARHNIPAHSLSGAFHECSGITGERYYFRNDGHWNASGHRLAARAIFGWLLANPDWWPGDAQQLAEITPPPVCPSQ
jgi:lysophospholipase L1-like esterase